MAEDWEKKIISQATDSASQAVQDVLRNSDIPREVAENDKRYDQFVMRVYESVTAQLLNHL